MVSVEPIPGIAISSPPRVRSCKEQQLKGILELPRADGYWKGCLASDGVVASIGLRLLFYVPR